MSERFYLALLAFGFACVVVLAPLLFGEATAAASANNLTATGTGGTTADEAARSLAEGTSHLRRNRSDLALPLLESALKLFTQANNRSGLAAASDALGDIYLRHGQYQIAIEHFGRAAEAFSAQNETANAALMFAKLGETYYLAGDEPAARAAFARIGEGEKKNSGAAGVGLNASGGSSSNSSIYAGGGAANLLTFASLSALLPDSCLSSTRPTNSVPALNSVALNTAAHIAVPSSGNTPSNPLNTRPGNPNGNPSTNPPGRPPGNPSNNPTGKPTNNPSSNPSGSPSNNPSGNPSSNNPTNPSGNSTGNPTGKPANNSPGNPSGNSANSPSGNSSGNPANNSTGSSPNNPSNNATGKPSGNSSGSSSNRPSGNNDGMPNMGRAPKKLDDLGRMDLRVFDENGNPVKGAKARLSTTRPNGIFCDCVNETNAAGRAVLPAIHVGKTLKLEVNAPGFEPLEQIVPAEKLAEPFKVTLQSKNPATSIPKPGQKFAHAVFPRRSVAINLSLQDALEEITANTESATGATNSLTAPVAVQSSCFDFSRLFIAYATSELRLARADFNRNQFDAARAHYLNVLAAADTNAPAGNLAAARLFRAVSRTSLGDIALRQSRFTDALKFYGQAADLARADGRAELTWAAERGLGKTYWVMAAVARDEQAETKNRNESIKHYRAALGVIETLFAGSLRADNARVNFLATTKDVFDEAASVFAELALANSPPASRDQASLAHASSAAQVLEGQSLTYAAEAFRIVEQGKARSLLDMLGDARAELREGVPAALLARKSANMARQQEIAGLLGGVTFKGAAIPPQQTVPELEAELEQLTVEFNSLENQIMTSSPRYAALVRATPLALAEVQRQVLDDSTVLLEYNLGAQQSYLFAVTKNGLTLYRLPSRAQIERQAVELRQQLVPAGLRRAIAGINVESTRGLTLGAPSTASAKVGAYVATANALYKTVVAPASAMIGDRRLLVVPDGALNYVPFESLVANTQGVDYSTLSYLIKTNEIVYAPSASVVAGIRQQAAKNKAGRGAATGGMLLVADPVFDASDARLKGSSQGAMRARESGRGLTLASALKDVTNLKGDNLKLVRLDGTRAEAEQIAQLARSSGGQADVWLDFDASEENLQERKLDNYRVLHFATHGLLDAERPQFTGLAFSLVGETNADGFLRVDEVFNLRLGSPLVILSACETGLGKERRGEGVIGLTRAFMYAGAPTVGVSLWSVGDKSTSELMPDFYRRLLAGQGNGAPASAMRAAQISMIAGKKYSAPFYWAPFVLVGDWR